MIHSLTPRQLAFTALALGTIDAGAACGVAVGLFLKAAGCHDVYDLREIVKDWKKRNAKLDNYDYNKNNSS